MKLWIIYPNVFENGGTSPRRMSEAAFSFNIDNEVMYSDYFHMQLDKGNETLYYKGKRVSKYPDVVFFRCYKYEIMNFLEKRGVKVINGVRGMSVVRNKFKTHQIVDKLGVLQPKFLYDKDGNFDFISKQLGVPFIMKNNIGSKGNNVYLVYSKEQLEEIISGHSNIDFMYQQYIKESKGSDYRLYIVGDKVVGCVNRVADNDDFRANISQGGVGLSCEVPYDIKKQSLLIAKTLGLEICSIDYLKKGNQYYFCEGNGVAGFLAFTRLGYKMQPVFMKYISEKYELTKNNETKNMLDVFK